MGSSKSDPDLLARNLLNPMGAAAD